MESSKLPLVGLALTIFAVIFQLIGLASPYWFAQTEGGFKANAGLWKYCAGSDDNIKCSDIDDVLKDAHSFEKIVFQQINWVKTVQAMSIMGFIALLVALVMACLKMCVMKDNKALEWLAIVAAFAAAFFILISILVYADEIDLKKKKAEYHFAFVFCMIAMLAAIAAGSLMMVHEKK